jgi:serine/threonine protein kinase
MAIIAQTNQAIIHEAVVKIQAHDDEEYEAEINALCRLHHVPGIVKIFGSYEVDTSGCIVMEYVRGESFLDIINDPDYTTEDLLVLYEQLVTVVKAMHEAGVVHGDLKPDNVMVRPTGEVVLIDFGHSIVGVTEDTPDPGFEIGTAEYVPPEGSAAGLGLFKCDMYSMGVILYDVLMRKDYQEGDPLPDNDRIRRLMSHDPDEREF